MGAEIGVFFCQVGHVLPAPDVLLPFPGLALLVIAWFDEGTLATGFEIEVVLFAFIACICNNIGVAALQVALHVLQERDECGGIRRLGADCCPGDEFGIRAALDIVGWF